MGLLLRKYIALTVQLHTLGEVEYLRLPCLLCFDVWLLSGCAGIVLECHQIACFFVLHILNVLVVTADHRCH